MQGRKRGFTLIEVVIAVGITALLSGFILTYNSRGREVISLGVERAKLTQIILQAKSLAIATYNKEGVPCGYGVLINYANSQATSYELFSYKPASCANLGKISADAEGYKRINDAYSLPNGLRFAERSDSLEYVFFIPPDPRTIIATADNPASDSGKIHLVSPGHATSIKVGNGGQVTFADD